MSSGYYYDESVGRCECNCGLVGCHSRRADNPDARGGMSHGTVQAYDNGCRCAECRECKTRKHRKRMARIQGELIDKAEKRYQPWTGPELEYICRDDVPIREMAATLGRTYAGVQGMRQKCRHDPKYQKFVGLSEDGKP